MHRGGLNMAVGELRSSQGKAELCRGAGRPFKQSTLNVTAGSRWETKLDSNGVTASLTSKPKPPAKICVVFLKYQHFSGELCGGCTELLSQPGEASGVLVSRCLASITEMSN